MYSTATLQIQEQQEVQEGDFGAQGGRAGQSRSGYMGGISRQAAMDIHYAGQQGQLQSGIRNFYGETAWNASAANSATSRRGENAAAFEGVASHGHGSHGVNGKEVGRAFHEGSEGSIQSNPDSWAPEQAEQAHKLKSQVATAAQKIKDLDGEWATFVNTTLSKVRHHGEMFQNCRADLMEHYNAKIQELATVKKEMTLASQSMLGPQWTESSRRCPTWKRSSMLCRTP